MVIIWMPSTSASYVILGFAVFVAFAALWSAGADTAEQVSGALADQREQTDRLLDTHIEITSATHNDSTLNVTVENTGRTRLALGRTDLVVDGRYHQAEDLNASATATTVLHIGEKMAFGLTVDDPEIVTVVTEQGVAATARVTNGTGGTPTPTPAPTPTPGPGPPFKFKNDVAFVPPSAAVGNSEPRSVLNDTDVETGYAGNGERAIGPVVEDFTQTNKKEIPAINGSGFLTVNGVNGGRTVLATNPTTGATRLAAGRWPGNKPSIFYASASGELYRVTSNGAAVKISRTFGGSWVTPARVKAVAGIADIDGDGSDEVVYGGDGPSGSSDSINYVEKNRNVVGTNGAYGTSTGIGLGEPADFDGDGVARVAYVDGSNNIKLVNATGSPTSITSAGPAKKSPMASTDVDADGTPEIVFLNQTRTLKYVDSVGTNDRIRLLTNSSGVSITGQEAPGAA